jgi:hypothetical protein
VNNLEHSAGVLLARLLPLCIAASGGENKKGLLDEIKNKCYEKLEKIAVPKAWRTLLAFFCESFETMHCSCHMGRHSD